LAARPPGGTVSSGFHRVLAAETVSNFGSMLSRLAIPWLATLMLAATPLQMGWLLVADFAAGAFGALLLGAAIDHAPKRAVMLLCDLLRAALLAVLAFLAHRQLLVWWMLVVAAAASGLLTVAFELARSAWVALRVDARELPRRNAQLSLGGSLSETAAFALGGWVYQGAGAIAALAVDAASYFASALCLHGVPEAQQPVGMQPAQGRARWVSFVQEVGGGLRLLAGSEALRSLALVEGLVALGTALAGTSYMIFVSRDVGFATGPLGMIFAVGGLGAVAGAMFAPWLGARFGAGRAMALGLVAAAVGAACVPLVGAATAVGAALLVLQQLVGDGGQALREVHDRTLRQTLVPAPLLARADAGIRSVGQAAMLAGALWGGWLATRLGTRSTLAASAMCFAFGAGFAWFGFTKRRPAAA